MQADPYVHAGNMLLTRVSGTCSTILAHMPHDQLQQVGVLKMGDRLHLPRTAARNRKNDQFEHDSASAADFLSEENRMAAPIVQALAGSRVPSAFYSTFLANGRKVRFG
jgi:hypothetical protein